MRRGGVLKGFSVSRLFRAECLLAAGPCWIGEIMNHSAGSFPDVACCCLRRRASLPVPVWEGTAMTSHLLLPAAPHGRFAERLPPTRRAAATGSAARGRR
jgi:hypothetical protein